MPYLFALFLLHVYKECGVTLWLFNIALFNNCLALDLMVVQVQQITLFLVLLCNRLLVSVVQQIALLLLVLFCINFILYHHCWMCEVLHMRITSK